MDRFRGCLLGVLSGDVLGAPVEGLSAGQIRRHIGMVTTVIPGADGVARYTDDTQQTLALARSLVRCDGRVDGAACAAACATAYAPQRGYGRSATTILQALRCGASWQQTGSLLFPGGSFGNGAAMRIAPVGLLYGSESEDVLRAAVTAAVAATHVHPEAIEGAVMLARTIGRARESGGAVGKLPDNVIFELIELCRHEALAARLLMVEKLLRRKAAPGMAQRVLGSGVRSLESVPFAIFVAMRFMDDPLGGLLAAVNAGGDTDTVAAMVGAVLGAGHGTGFIPADWLSLMETGVDGLDGLRDVADALERLFGVCHSQDV